MVPKVRVELTQGHPYRFLSLSPCVPLDLTSLFMFHNRDCNVPMCFTRPQETLTLWATFWATVLGLTNQRGRAKYLTTKISLLRSSRAERIKAIHSRRKIVSTSNNLSARTSTAAQLSCKMTRTRCPSHSRYALNSCHPDSWSATPMPRRRDYYRFLSPRRCGCPRRDAFEPGQSICRFCKIIAPLPLQPNRSWRAVP